MPLTGQDVHMKQPAGQQQDGRHGKPAEMTWCWYLLLTNQLSVPIGIEIIDTNLLMSLGQPENSQC